MQVLWLATNYTLGAVCSFGDYWETRDFTFQSPEHPLHQQKLDIDTSERNAIFQLLSIHKMFTSLSSTNDGSKSLTRILATFTTGSHRKSTKTTRKPLYLAQSSTSRVLVLYLQITTFLRMKVYLVPVQIYRLNSSSWTICLARLGTDNRL